ncbi:MAG: DUF4080 domain-containing protein [Phycisphaeraceae bacterium]
MDILLTTINAKYPHASFGLRYLLANLGSLRGQATMLEFDLNHRSVDMVEAILAREPRIVGIGVYIWNIAHATQLVADLKRVRPDLTLILGGPEVSYETDQQEIIRLADYTITGEADLAFAQLCEQLLRGEKPLTKVIEAPLPTMEDVALPYHEYDDRDVAHRVIYVEASRGCPFKCEFCLSSLDIPVRNVPLDAFLGEIRTLLERGVRQFKFVDRTFNLNLSIGKRILAFFLEHYAAGLFLHFEMIPDRLPEGLRELIRQFPPGALQFEVGIQTFNDEVSDRISRRQDNAKLEDNLRWLRSETGVHVHSDLIVGLPGEDVASFGRGFDRLVSLKPQEIQVGMLKRLRGTPIVRHDEEWGMVYSPTPPYEILATKAIDFTTMQRMRRFARYWDMVANSGNFLRTTALIWEVQGPRAKGQGTEEPSPFAGFQRFAEWLHERATTTHGIALTNLVQYLFTYLTQELSLDPHSVAPVLLEDYQRGNRSDVPPFLREYLRQDAGENVRPTSKGPRRQARHLA